MVGYSKGLNNTVISDGDTWHAPFVGLLYNVFYLRNTIHITHLGMAVKFNTLYISSIYSFTCKVRYLLDSYNRLDRQLMVKLIHSCYTFELKKCTRLDILGDIRYIFSLNEHLDCYGICKVSNIEDKNTLLVSDISFIKGYDLTMNSNFAKLSDKI